MTHPRTESELLGLLRGMGARTLVTVRLMDNRSTIWSLTQGGRALQLHRAYGSAGVELLAHFVVIVNEAAARTRDFRTAAAAVRSWPGLLPELRRIRKDTRKGGRGRDRRPPLRPRQGPCCGSPEQIRYLRSLYLHLNESRFAGRLPEDLPLRLSSRMRSRLGQMVPGRSPGCRWVVEIALNVDLLLEGNYRARMDTLLHEMAHAAEWLVEGGVGHGPGWRRWARQAGCRVRSCSPTPIRRRPPGVPGVERVPPLPLEVEEVTVPGEGSMAWVGRLTPSV